MGVRHLDHRPDAHVDDDEVLAYADVVAILRARNHARRRVGRTLRHAYTIPLRPNQPIDERYVTVEMEYRGDFNWEKDNFSYVLNALDLE